MYNRELGNEIKKSLSGPRKVIVLYGARQVGKTTLVNQILDAMPGKILRLSADDRTVAEAFGSRDMVKLNLVTGGYDILFLDEAQRIPDIGLSIKLLHDQRSDLRIILTGSSSLEIASQTKESLAGRTRTFILQPISLSELALTANHFELDRRLEELLLFGSYPEVFSYASNTDKELYLRELCASYLYKDVLELLQLKHGSKLNDLLRLLAFQIGSQVSLSELGSQLSLSKNTVSHYLDLLEKSFVVFRLRGFSRNLRKEMAKMDKIYFCDLGIRNSIIGNHKSLAFRDDTGHLWENFLMIERLKSLGNKSIRADAWFWRIHTGAELDLVEDRDGQLHGYEFKWGQKIAKPPKSWLETYPGADWQLVNRQNYLEWLLA